MSDSRIEKLIEDTAAVIWAYPEVEGGPRVYRDELASVLEIFDVPRVAEISPDQEPAFRRYLDARMNTFRFPIR